MQLWLALALRFIKMTLYYYPLADVSLLGVAHTNTSVWSSPHDTSPHKPHPAILIDPSTSPYDRFFYPIEIAYGAYSLLYSNCHSFPVHVHRFNWHFTPSIFSLKCNIKINQMQAFSTHPPPWHTPSPTVLEYMTEILTSNCRQGLYFKGGYIECYLGEALRLPVYNLANPKFPHFSPRQPWTDAAQTTCMYHTRYHDMSCSIVHVKATQYFQSFHTLHKNTINSIVAQYQLARSITPTAAFPNSIPPTPFMPNNISWEASLCFWMIPMITSFLLFLYTLFTIT